MTISDDRINRSTLENRSENPNRIELKQTQKRKIKN